MLIICKRDHSQQPRLLLNIVQKVDAECSAIGHVGESANYKWQKLVHAEWVDPLPDTFLCEDHTAETTSGTIEPPDHYAVLVVYDVLTVLSVVSRMNECGLRFVCYLHTVLTESPMNHYKLRD